ncbi:MULTISPECIES: MarR family transcriptional regulator [unclassified Clostridium]|uniref:MarR family winged helix-turn-helix transcriptional regulator n=1 Tax=unclassified Clostridium TaxID=2614128 RepID=UPI00291443F6|nr:MarR family transcriptional regulator [Clostridium sp.]MDU5108062.1 MarR family transcriptional regulator [Clostridium sp.]
MKELECENIAKYISEIQRMGNIFFLKELCHLGLGYGQFNFLMELYKEDGVRQEDLSLKLKIDKGTTARAIKKLKIEGFITKVPDEKDKRAYRIFLTEKGMEHKKDIYKVAKSWEKNLTKNLTIEEKEIILNLLKKCI